MNTSEKSYSTRRLVIRESAVRGVEVSVARGRRDESSAQLELAPNPGNFRG